MAAGSSTRNWLHALALAGAILIVGFARQYANADGVFQTDGLVNTASEKLSQWLSALKLLEPNLPANEPSAAEIVPTPFATPAFDDLQPPPADFIGGPHDCIRTRCR